MADEISKKVQAVLSARHEAAERKAEEKMRFLYENEPEFAKLQSALSAAGRDAVQAAMNSDKEKASLAHETIDRLVAQEYDFLEKKGYGKKYTEPNYFCEKCRDTGIITANGITERCSCCIQLILDEFSKESGLSCSGIDFGKFDITFYPDEVNKEKYSVNISPRKNAEYNLSVCRNFAENFADCENLLFIGKSGTGKTFTCSCIASSLIRAGVPVMYITSYKLFSGLTGYNYSEDDKESAKSLEELVRKTPVLIIDDLGAENTTDARRAALLDIINERENNNNYFPCRTVISSNLSLSDMKNYYGERFVSRIIGNFKILNFAGDDIRLAKAQRR